MRSAAHRTRSCGFAIAAVALAGFAAPAAAHVKWFCAGADVREMPVPLAVVASPVFVAVLALFASLVFAGFLLDGAAARRWPLLASCGDRFDGVEERVVRAVIGGFFLLLWDKSAVVPWEHGTRSLLTPELDVSQGWIGTLQVLIALATTTRTTCVFAALGILALYGRGIAEFGLFHMTDYVFFPGMAAYLALTSYGTARAIRLRVPVLAATLAFGLMWTAVEKFVYPQWTLSIVTFHPELAFGFPPRFVVVTAGFVEFTLAFFIMTGRGLVRFGAAGYALIFVSAIPVFGHLDTVGHIPIVGILLAVCLHGASPLQRLLRVEGLGRTSNAAAIAGVYLLSLGAFFALYYGLHAAEYGVAPPPRGTAVVGLEGRTVR